MYEVTKLLEEFTPNKLIGYVKHIPENENWIGSQFLPTENINDLSFEYIKGSYERPVMASVMTWDAEAPIAGKKGTTTISGELPPIKRKAKIEEKELIKYFSPRAGLGDRQVAINDIYNIVDDLVMSARARMEWMRWQVLGTGKLTVDEGGIDFEVDYGVPASQQETLLTTARWSDLDDSDPLGDIETWCQNHVTNTGIRPKEMVMSLVTRNYLLKNEAMRQIITSEPDVYISPQQLNQVLENFELPKITVYDAKVLTEENDGSKTESRFLPNDVVILLPGAGYEVGKLLNGPTAEALTQIDADKGVKPEGVIAVMYSYKDPPSFWIKVAVTAMPTLPGAELLGIYNVW